MYTSFTCVGKNVLNDILYLFKGEVVLWSLACVSVYWSRVEVAGFDVLQPFYADSVEKKKGSLANMVTLMKKMRVSCLSLCRTGAVMTLYCCRLEGVSHDLPHYNEI